MKSHVWYVRRTGAVVWRGACLVTIRTRDLRCSVIIGLVKAVCSNSAFPLRHI